MTDSTPISVDHLRNRIDAIDDRIVELLNARAAIAIEIGRVKRQAGTPIVSPQREHEVMRRAQAINCGPLSNEAVAAIYHQIICGSSALE